MKALQNPGDADTRMILGRVYKLHRDLNDAKTSSPWRQLQPGARDAWEELPEVCRSLKRLRVEITALEGLLNFSADKLALIDQILEPARRCELRDTTIRYLELKIALAPDHGASYAELGRLFQHGQPDPGLLLFPEIHRNLPGLPRVRGAPAVAPTRN